MERSRATTSASRCGRRRRSAPCALTPASRLHLEPVEVVAGMDDGHVQPVKAAGRALQAVEPLLRAVGDDRIDEEQRQQQQADEAERDPQKAASACGTPWRKESKRRASHPYIRQLPPITMFPPGHGSCTSAARTYCSRPRFRSRCPALSSQLPIRVARRPVARALAAPTIRCVHGVARDAAAAAVSTCASQAGLATVRRIAVAVAPLRVALVIAASALAHALFST